MKKLKHTYIVRILRDGAGRVAGQVSDPVEGWRLPFGSPQELWQLLIGAGEQEQGKAKRPEDNSSSNRTT